MDIEARSLGTSSSKSELRRSFLQRSFSDIHPGGVRQSMLTLVSTAVGGGVLSLSYVFFLSGVGLGCFMLVAGACLAYLSTVILMQLSAETGIGTYAGLFSHCAGPMAAPFLDTMLFVYGNGVCIGYLVFLGDIIPDLLSLDTSLPMWTNNRVFAIIASAAIVAPAVVQKDQAVLRYFAPLSVIALLYVTTVIVADMPSQYKAHLDDAAHGSITLVKVDMNLFEAFSICLFAYNCHMSVVPVASNLSRPTLARINKVSSRANLLQFGFYTLIGLAGHLSFIADTPQDILTGYDRDSRAIAVGRALLTLAILVSLPLNGIPAMHSGLSLLSSIRGADKSEAWWERTVLGLCCVVAQATIAIKCPGVAAVLSILGATCATSMILVIPAYCLGVAMPRTSGNKAKQAVMLIFACFGFATVPISMMRAAGQ